MAHEAGKGGASRPLSIPRDEFAEKFVGIFGERKRTNGGWTPPPLPETASVNTSSEHKDKAAY